MANGQKFRQKNKLEHGFLDQGGMVFFVVVVVVVCFVVVVCLFVFIF